MYRVADRHHFISKGVRFDPGDEITEKAFSSAELFLKKVEAGHIYHEADPDEKKELDTKELEAAIKAAAKAAKKKKETAEKAVEKARAELAKAREDLAACSEDEKAGRQAVVDDKEKALADKNAALEEALSELAALEGED
jgi:hypothetical protein